jgi:mRNA-degrading endonuclease RelE of RelBE toxin-antitoxin system
MDFRLLIANEVLEFVERLPRQIGQHLRSAVKDIGRDPYGRSDEVGYDEIGRRIEIAVVGDYALMFWIDEADRHVKILDIHAVNR